MFRLHDHQRGISLIELMIAMALGLIIMTAIGSLFVASSRSHTELQKSAAQIENGRYSIETITEDLKHAGFYGRLSVLPALSGAPDPCETGSAATLLAATTLPVQAFRAANFTSRPDITATSCGALLPNSNLAPGSDVIVVRRGDTHTMAAAETATLNEVYIQANSFLADIRFGNGNTLAVNGGTANNSTPATVLKKDLTPADVRKYQVHVYFVAPCSVASGANGKCAVGDDSIPTLKRLELKVDPSTGNLAMVIAPLVEGIDYLKAEWGIDDQPTTINVSTNLPGDGVVDSYVAAPSNVQLSNAVAAKVFVLARNTEATSGYVDDKTYTLGTVGGTTTAATSDAFKRHAFASEVRLMNVGGRKEIPE